MPSNSKVFYICSALTCAYLGYHILPLVGGGTVRHAVLLAENSKDAFMQESAANRLKMLCRSSRVANQLVEEGAIRALLRLLTVAQEAKVLLSAAEALELILVESDAGVEQLQQADGVQRLEALARASTNPAVKEKLESAAQTASNLSAQSKLRNS